MEYWSSLVGYDNVSVLDYQTCSKNGGLLKSFCETIGMERAELSELDTANEKMTLEQLYSMLELNKRELPKNQWYIERQEILSSKNICRHSLPKKLLTKTDAQIIKNKYHDDNISLKKIFGVDLNIHF